MESFAYYITSIFYMLCFCASKNRVGYKNIKYDPQIFMNVDLWCQNEKGPKKEKEIRKTQIIGKLL